MLQLEQQLLQAFKDASLDFSINDEKIQNKKGDNLYLFLVLAPIVSLLIYYGFHIITAIQVALFAPTIMAILIIIVDKLANITVNIDKIKKIFIKK